MFASEKKQDFNIKIIINIVNWTIFDQILLIKSIAKC